MPSFATIVTPLKPDHVAECRAYLAANADPLPDIAHGRLICRPLFPFDAVATLHFCSFVILDAEDGFGPSLVFEATFDGARADFLRDLLLAAPTGFDKIYRHCDGYPASGIVAPDLVQEYLERHDVGAHAFFSGAPGRSATQIQDEERIHAGVARFLASPAIGASARGRLTDLFDLVRRDFIRGEPGNRWAATPAALPWEVAARGAVAAAARVGFAALAYLFGVIVGAALPGLRPWALYEWLTSVIGAVGEFDAGFGESAARLPLIGNFVHAVLPALPTLFGATAIWAALRFVELVLGAKTKRPRDQSFYLRIPLQIAIILRIALVFFLAGAVLLVAINGMERDAVAGSKPASIALGVLYLLVTTAALVPLRYAATSLNLEVELRSRGATREKWRRLQLDIVNYATVLVCVTGLLAVARQTPLTLGPDLAERLRGGLSVLFVVASYGVIGVVAGYCVASLLFLLVRWRELADRTALGDPAALIQRAGINARKYDREEGGANAFQNHLASLTHVKPGALRRIVLRLALFAVNLLARFWFNRGELGGIPTILSARWVMIDEGRRLLFLDNFGGAWDSYLNEFIDLPAVKGLNAIWANTFVRVARRGFGFPATEFLFWKGAQDEKPFKAYVRQSQIETLVWYGAYPTLSVANINANTELRQSFGRALSPGEVDAVFQRL